MRNGYWTQKDLDNYHARMAQAKRVQAPQAKRTQNAPKTRRVASEQPTGVNTRHATVREPNETEARFNRDFLNGDGIYEGVSFRLPGKTKRPIYTPDWVWFDKDGTMWVFEVKGSHHFPSENRASVAFEVASSFFRTVRFVWARLTKDKRWDFEKGEQPIWTGGHWTFQGAGQPEKGEER